ncbi:hypothetical protein [Rheinheimera sp. NSM]|uniref:hypothetical protein n=1 Tax=Rheinheimera sp. NSM TaxID=3457884 RepID=UPI0040372E19
MNLEQYWQQLTERQQLHYHGMLTVNCVQNYLTVPSRRCLIRLTEPQKRLFACLILGTTAKGALQHKIWFDRPQPNPGDSYHQLLQQVRRLLSKQGLGGLLLINPGSGVRLNPAVLVRYVAAAPVITSFNNPARAISHSLAEAKCYDN